MELITHIPAMFECLDLLAHRSYQLYTLLFTLILW